MFLQWFSRGRATWLPEHRFCCSLESQSLISFSEPNLGEDDEDKDLEPGPSGTSKASAQISGQSDTDITAEFLQPLLTPDNVANLVRRVRPSQGWESGSQSFPYPCSADHVLVASARSPSHPWMGPFSRPSSFQSPFVLTIPLPHHSLLWGEILSQGNCPAGH